MKLWEWFWLQLTRRKHLNYCSNQALGKTLTAAPSWGNLRWIWISNFLNWILSKWSETQFVWMTSKICLFDKLRFNELWSKCQKRWHSQVLNWFHIYICPNFKYHIYISTKLCNEKIGKLMQATMHSNFFLKRNADIPVPP